MAAALVHFLDELRDALYPPRCLVCGRFAEDGRLCPGHALPARPRGPRCGRCAAALAPALPDGSRCPECRSRSPGFRGVVALGDYRGAGLDDWILALKHGGRADLAEPLGRALAEAWGTDRRGAPWRRVLVPVPLHPLRRIERGYDQALLLARAVGCASGVPLFRALRRSRATPPQGSALARSRRANVADAFRLCRAAQALAGADAWLVDDVLTSGATAEACARLLRAAGVRAVYVLCVGRAGAMP